MTAPRALRSTQSASPDEAQAASSSLLPIPSDTDPISRPNSSSSQNVPNEEMDHSSSRSNGCWTCRVRRKRCDEQRLDGSCATCLRLKIQCLGWGNQRPEWMKDKEQVALYKAQIKQQLIRSGRIRGQPKSVMSSSTVSRPASAPTLPTVPSVPSIPSTPSSSTYGEYFRPEDSFEGYADSSGSSAGGGTGGGYGTSPMMPLGTGKTWRLSHRNLPPRPGSIRKFSDSSSYPRHSPRTVPYIHTTRLHPPVASANPGIYPAVSLQDSPTYIVPEAGPSHQVVKSSQEKLVLYYFKSVFHQQYPLADSSLLNALHGLVIKNPEGPVALSICALAGLYAFKTVVPTEFQIDASIASNCGDYFNWSYYQLEEMRRHNSPLTEAEAISAIQLLMYLVLEGSNSSWQFLLKVAGDWLENSHLNVPSGARAIFTASSEVTKFACRGVLWLDAFASMTLRSSPRFLQFHELLLRPNNLPWPSVVEGSQEADSVHINTLMGCPDNVMLALALTADLESWKNQQRMNGSLSIQSLCDRARNIEILLQQGRGSPSSSSPYPGPLGDVSRHASPVNISNLPATATTSPAPYDPSPVRYSPSTRFGSLDIYGFISDIFHIGALLYLFTVVNGHFPHVPEIHERVQAMINTVKQLPITTAERGLVFPLFLAGVLADEPMERTVFQNRLAMQDSNIGSVASAQKLMEAVWSRRDLQRGIGIDWRDVMNEMGLSLLLI